MRKPFYDRYVHLSPSVLTVLDPRDCTISVVFASKFLLYYSALFFFNIKGYCMLLTYSLVELNINYMGVDLI